MKSFVHRILLYEYTVNTEYLKQEVSEATNALVSNSIDPTMHGKLTEDNADYISQMV